MTNTIESEIVSHAIDKLNDGIGLDQPASELHHYLFNEDYFIIGYYEAEKFLSNGPGVFSDIETIKEYEQDNFGEVHTDFSSSEKVANMYAYIKGEELLQKSRTLQSKWDSILDQDDINSIIEELED